MTAFRIVVLIVGVLAVCRAEQRHGSDRAGPAVADYKGFGFDEPACQSTDAECQMRGPRRWTADEVAVVRKAIDEIDAAPRSAPILSRVGGAGIMRLRRYSIGVVGATPVPAMTAAYRRDAQSGLIELYDRYFANPAARDIHAGRVGHLLVSSTLLHECFHAIDVWSWQPQFATQAGFVRAGARWRFEIRTPEDARAIAQFDQELAGLRRAGDVIGEARLNRRVALSMRPVRSPTMKGLSSPTEAFAEIGTHLVLEPAAQTYLSPAVVRYFDERVFAAGAK